MCLLLNEKETPQVGLLGSVRYEVRCGCGCEKSVAGGERRRVDGDWRGSRMKRGLCC